MWWSHECRSVARLLWDYGAERLPDPDRARVQSHIEQCRFCRREAEAYRRTVSLVASDRESKAPDMPAAWQALRVGLDAVRPLPPARRSRAIRPSVAWVLAAGILLVAGIATRWMLRSPSVPQ